VIDYGTATTFNLIIKGVFKGGLISPGVGTSLRSLVDNSTLPFPKLNSKSGLISNITIENIKFGVINSAVFTTERVIAELKKKYKNLFVIATGGFSVIIKKNTKVIDLYSEKLVLEGLNKIIRI
jgi:type III pantothenate kinase